MASAKKILVIVESPSKAKTIGKYLGSHYKVIASVGHVRDLPKSKLGIDIENDFEPQYISIRGKGEIIKELRKEAKKLPKSIWQQTRTRRGSHFLASGSSAGSGSGYAPAGSYSMKLQEYSQGSHQASEKDRSSSGGRSAGAPGSGQTGRLSDQSSFMAKSQEGSVRRACAVGLH